MFIAGDLERDAELIERILTILEGARVAACPSQHPDQLPLRLGEITFDGPSRMAPTGPEAPL